jgi:hypothetical protein
MGLLIHCTPVFLQYLTHAELSVADYVAIQNDYNFVYIVTFYGCARQ